MSNLVMELRQPNMVFDCRSDMHIRECNKRMLDKLGISREEALERYIFEFIEVEDIEQVLEDKKSIFKETNSVRNT